MTIRTPITFEREDGDITAQVSGEVRCHYRQLHVTELTSDIALSPEEKEYAKDVLRDMAGAWHDVPEEEPEARAFNRY